MASATLAFASSSSCVLAKSSLPQKQQTSLSVSLSNKPSSSSFLSPSLPPSSSSLSLSTLTLNPQPRRPTFETQARLTKDEAILLYRAMNPKSDEEAIKKFTDELRGKEIKPKPDVTFEEIYAVVMIGGRQFIVIPGRYIYLPRLKGANVNDKVVLNKVLLVGKRDSACIGFPLVTNAVVNAVVEEQLLDDKVIVFKYKKKKNYRRNIGHRQPITRLKITSITGYEDYPASTLDQLTDSQRELQTVS